MTFHYWKKLYDFLWHLCQHLYFLALLGFWHMSSPINPVLLHFSITTQICLYSISTLFKNILQTAIPIKIFFKVVFLNFLGVLEFSVLVWVLSGNGKETVVVVNNYQLANIFLIDQLHHFFSIKSYLVKIRFIHEDEFGKICLWSDISWCKLYIEVKDSIRTPSLVVMSWVLHIFDFVLKSPSTIKKLMLTV